MRRRIAVMVAMVMMVLMMSAPSALAHHDVGHAIVGHKAEDGLDHNKGGGNDHAKQNHGKGND